MASAEDRVSREKYNSALNHNHTLPNDDLSHLSQAKASAREFSQENFQISLISKGTAETERQHIRFGEFQEGPNGSFKRVKLPQKRHMVGSTIAHTY